LKILAVIPARGGSKGIYRKNVRLFAGKPLIAWTILQAAAVPEIDTLICSTEDDQIAEIAKSHGCSVPFKRPAALASDEASGIEVLLHAIDYFGEIGKIFDVIVNLPCIAPLRRTQDIRDAIRQFEKSSHPNLVSVCRAEHPPYWMYRIGTDGGLQPVLGGGFANKRRQDLPEVLRPNGAIHISRVDTLRRNRDFNLPSAEPFIMPQDRSIDIDNEMDFQIAEFLFRTYNGVLPQGNFGQ